MKTYIKASGILAMCIATLTSCEPEEQLTGTTTTLDCDYFNQDRVLVDDPEVTIDYLVTCDMLVTADITVMPGVTIAFATDAGIVVQETGSFKAEGTAAQPITFTGQDGVKGSWRGVLVNSNDPKNVFDHCVVEHAGGTAHNSNGDRGAFVIWSQSKVSITNTTIRESATHGVNAVYGESQITLGGNTISGNDGAPLYLDDNYVGVPTPTDIYAGNGNPRIMIRVYSGRIEENVTWRKVDVDYQVTGASDVRVEESAVLIVEEGVSVYFEAGCSLTVTDEAALVAVGTDNDPIRFYGTTAANGSWGGLYFAHTSNVQNLLEYVFIEDAGGVDFDGAIYMWASPRLTVRNSYIGNSGSCGFYAGGSGSGNPNLTTENVSFAANNGADFCED